MAGPSAKGGMWRKGSNGKRVLITKSMAKQMAAGVSAQSGTEYADKAANLREQNNVKKFDRGKFSKKIDNMKEAGDILRDTRKKIDKIVEEDKERRKKAREFLKDSRLERKKDGLEVTFIQNVSSEKPRPNKRRKAVPGKNDMKDFARKEKLKEQQERKAEIKKQNDRKNALKEGKVVGNQETSGTNKITPFERREARAKRVQEEIKKKQEQAKKKKEQEKKKRIDQQREKIKKRYKSSKDKRKDD